MSERAREPGTPNGSRAKPLAILIDHSVAHRALQGGMLAEDGWRVRACPGPPFVPCPVLADATECPRAAAAEVVLLASTHPRFAELLDAYRRRYRDAGIALIFPEDQGPSADVLVAADAVAIRGDRASLRSACIAAREAAARRKGVAS